jgi:predicted small lipoprotein YifL
MKKILKQLLLVLAVLSVMALVGCKEKGPLEKAGKAVDKAAEKTGDAVKDAADETKDAVENK